MELAGMEGVRRGRNKRIVCVRLCCARDKHRQLYFFFFFLFLKKSSTCHLDIRVALSPTIRSRNQVCRSNTPRVRFCVLFHRLPKRSGHRGWRSTASDGIFLGNPAEEEIAARGRGRQTCMPGAEQEAPEWLEGCRGQGKSAILGYVCGEALCWLDHSQAHAATLRGVLVGEQRRRCAWWSSPTKTACGVCMALVQDTRGAACRPRRSGRFSHRQERRPGHRRQLGPSYNVVCRERPRVVVRDRDDGVAQAARGTQREGLVGKIGPPPCARNACLRCDTHSGCYTKMRPRTDGPSGSQPFLFYVLSPADDE